MTTSPISSTRRGAFLADATDLFRRHVNPDGDEGGWVAITATVDPNCWVGSLAIVAGTARVRGGSHVGNRVIVAGRALVDNGAFLAGHAVVSGDAVVSGGFLGGFAVAT